MSTDRMAVARAVPETREGLAVTQNQMFAELEHFRGAIHELSDQLPEDHDFWPAYAEKANELEASCPIELRDYARESILRTVHVVAARRSRL